MGTITVVGGGLAGLVASIATAEAGHDVVVHEAHRELGGKARTTKGEFAANYGPHVLYNNGALWAWLAERRLLAGAAKPPWWPNARFRYRGEVRRIPPLAVVRAARTMFRRAPVEVDLRTWFTEQAGPDAATVACNGVGDFTYDADPGRLSAAFVLERARLAMAVPIAARYVPGGWGTLIGRLAAHARTVGVRIETASPVDALPEPPVIVATELHAARRLLGDETLDWTGTRTALLDVGLRARRGDPFIVSDLDEAGWVERFSAADPSLAPAGHSLLQTHMGLRAGETLDQGVARLEQLLDASFENWREREVWRRRAVVDNASGALDLPGTTWRDRPGIDRGGDVYLAGDMVAAPGLLSDVSFNSAIEAARLAVRAIDTAHSPRPAAKTVS